MEAILLYSIHYDVLENDSGAAISEKLLGVFVEDTALKLTAHGALARFLARRDPVTLYLANNGQVYPIYRTQRINLNQELK